MFGFVLLGILGLVVFVVLRYVLKLKWWVIFLVYLVAVFLLRGVLLRGFLF